MTELEHIMTNSELQDAIIQTNAIIKSCSPSSDRKSKLDNHLESLLDCQHSRAKLLKVL